MLKQLWRHNNAPGSQAGKTLKDLIAGRRPYIRSHRVLDALHDIQRLRNRSAHAGTAAFASAGTAWHRAQADAARMLGPDAAPTLDQWLGRGRGNVGQSQRLGDLDGPGHTCPGGTAPGASAEPADGSDDHLISLPGRSAVLDAQLGVPEDVIGLIRHLREHMAA